MSSPRIEIIKELRALEQFCTFKALRTGEENERFLKDYLADIEEFPLDAIRKACADWRRSGATKYPTSGQLIPMIRRHLLEERQGGDRPQPWTAPSEAEYEAMPLREKIRQRRIMAGLAEEQAFREAAKLGWDRNVQNAPQVWREHMARAASHHEEAARLKRRLRPVPVAAE